METKNFLNFKHKEELKIKNTNEFIPLKGLNETSIFSNSIKEVFENNTENNIKEENNKRNHKIFNLKNYEQIFKP